MIVVIITVVVCSMSSKPFLAAGGVVVVACSLRRQCRGQVFRQPGLDLHAKRGTCASQAIHTRGRGGGLKVATLCEWRMMALLAQLDQSKWCCILGFAGPNKHMFNRPSATLPTPLRGSKHRKEGRLGRNTAYKTKKNTRILRKVLMRGR